MEISRAERSLGDVGKPQQAANGIVRYVQEHPLQVILISAGVTWLATRRGRSSDYDMDYEGSMDSYGDRYDTNTYDDEETHRGPSTASRTRRVTEQVRSAASTATSQVRNAASTATSQVRNVASTATSQVQQGWQEAGSSLDRWIDENPLAVGAVALALGLAVGLSIRRTAIEDRTFGETRDSVIEQAGEVARGLPKTVAEKVLDVAEQVMGGPSPT